jgi:hypothetical protein
VVELLKSFIVLDDRLGAFCLGFFEFLLRVPKKRKSHCLLAQVYPPAVSG